MRRQTEPADDRKLLAEVDWTKPAAKGAVEDVVRQLAYGYVTGYLENGNSARAVYLDSAKPTVCGNGVRVDDRSHANDHRVSARTPAVFAGFSQGGVSGFHGFPVLTINPIRSQTDNAHQSSRHLGKCGRERRGVKGALCEPLLLDCPRTSRACFRPISRNGLVRHSQ
jgi:hypothetical protein